MPRYFFHVHDGAAIRDEEGTQLPDSIAARTEAVKLSAALLAERAEAFWNDDEWSLEVADETGLVLFSLTFYATIAPALRGGASFRRLDPAGRPGEGESGRRSAKEAVFN